MTTDFPTASVGSSQAPTAAVEKSLSASNTEIQTLPLSPLLPTEGSMPASAKRSLYRMPTYCEPRSE